MTLFSRLPAIKNVQKYPNLYFGSHCKQIGLPAFAFVKLNWGSYPLPCSSTTHMVSNTDKCILPSGKDTKNVFISVRYKNVLSHFWNVRLLLSHLCQSQTNIILTGSWTTFQTATTLIHSPQSKFTCNLHSVLPGNLAINPRAPFETTNPPPPYNVTQRPGSLLLSTQIASKENSASFCCFCFGFELFFSPDQ